jgi:transcriptional regulator with XRE-family HTH domain
MPKAKASRKQLFRAALAVEGLTAAQFAARVGVTPYHLSVVLNDKRDSRRLTDKIDAFVREKLEPRTARVG